MTRKICHHLANWWLIICQSMLFTFWFGDDYACSKLLFITVQFPPSWYPKQQRACCCKPADGHLQSSAQLHFDIVEACEDKLMLISWRIWSLSFWRRPFMHEFTELPLLNKKRFFFSFLNCGNPIHSFWLICLDVTPWVCCGSFCSGQSIEKLLQVLYEGINALWMLQIIKFYTSSRKTGIS